MHHRARFVDQAGQRVGVMQVTLHHFIDTTGERLRALR
jgi:hypothetical protein